MITMLIIYAICFYLTASAVITDTLTDCPELLSDACDIFVLCLISIGGPLSVIIAFFFFNRFKHGFNWIKAIKIARARMQIKKCKFDE